MNEIYVTFRGNVASKPRHVQFDDGNTVTSFRLASTSRYFDRARSEWVDRETTYASVNCRRGMAVNAAASLHKGNPVVVTGRLRERYWEFDGQERHTMEIEADAIGHDLTYGTATFVRVVRAERVRVEDPQGDEMAARVLQDASRERAVDVSGLPVMEADEPADDVDDRDAPAGLDEFMPEDDDADGHVRAAAVA
jgi:single-strand DNA-binding protein